MSIIPAFRAVLQPDVTDEQRQTLEKDVRALKGVVQVIFNRNADGEKYLHVNYMPGNGVERRVAAMDGVLRTHYTMS
ncbi:MAG: hypothetical protein Q8K65_08010 [Alphaproteobacteria bacterium]|nr:hypothetical protein [Alphaproteobacteria bacterium]